MSAIKRFWRFWRENFEATKGGFDIAALIVAVLLAIGCVLCKLMNFQFHIKGFLITSKFAGGCEIGAIVIFLGWCFLWLPFRSHEEQETAHKTEKENLISQVQQAEALFNSVAEHKDKPAEASSQQHKIRNSLEAYLVQMENRIHAIKNMTLLEYNKSLKNDEDIESIDLLNEIYFFLDLNMGKAESVFFKSRTGIAFTSINDWGQSAFKAEKWQGMIDSLTHYAGQLKKLIEEQE